MDKSQDTDPFSIERGKTQRKSSVWRKALNLVAVSLCIVTFFVRLWNNDESLAYQTNNCDQPTPAAFPSNLSSFTNEPGFRLEAAERLAGAVRIPTMSFDDMGPVEEDKRWAPFEDMHSYLRKTFPLVHSEWDLTLIGGYLLVYTWTGSIKDAKPLTLTGHIDVVPSLTALDRWTYPPFSGTINVTNVDHRRAISERLI